MFNYKKSNDLVAWVTGILATLVYWLTVEPTASFWDCSEFIATSYKLEVPHPPGAPLFLLMGRMFSFLAGGNVENVAYWINILSVIAAGFTAVFMFWSITLFGKKLMKLGKEDTPDNNQSILLLGAGFIGTMAYTFSDSAWFSGVEAEVYSVSSFFTAFIIWALLKWDLIEDEKRANRWIIMIAYMMGLSIGVHLLNLVTLPALALLYYYKKYKKTNIIGAFVAMFVGLIILALINSLLIQGLPSIALSVEVFFVNSLGLPFASGVIFFSAILLAGLVYGIVYSQKKELANLNTFFLATAFLCMGYAFSYAIIPIRSAYDTPIDENDPETIVSFISYLKREQYGNRPLLYGPFFDTEITGSKQTSPVYAKKGDKYVIVNHNIEYEYDKSHMTIFPRIYSNIPQHQEAYRNALDLQPGQKPTFADNIKFFFTDQLGRMYMRYFMWNFAGRASDMQGADWLSPLDIAQKDLPDLLKENKGRNNFLMLPFILGIIGLFFTYNRDPKVFAVIGMLFVMMGIALVVYLDMPPIEPRERDYIYVGSFYAFCFWIGLAVIAIGEWLIEKLKNPKPAVALTLLLSLSVPTVMAIEGWDDHDRSNRYFSVDSAKNLLDSCAPNAILFTGGDNDTFPLWYAQEVENYRTDVRVIVLSYFNTDWYINQMMKDQYESKALPFSFNLEDVKQGGPNDYIRYYANERIKGAIDAKQYLSLLQRKSPLVVMDLQNGDKVSTIPSKQMFLDIDTTAVKALNIIPKDKEQYIVDKMVWSMRKNGMEKNTLMAIDLIVSGEWKRPIYFNHTSLSSIGINLQNNVVQEGGAYRLLPINNPNPQTEFVSTDIMYNNMINKFHYRELNNPKVYYNEDYRNFVLNTRANLNTLAKSLILEGQEEKAKKVLLFNLEKMPNDAIPYDYTNAQTASLLFAIGQDETAKEIIRVLAKNAEQMLNYTVSNQRPIDMEVQRNFAILSELTRTLKNNNDTVYAKELEDKLNRHLEYLRRR